jgi:hypothetical protein
MTGWKAFVHYRTDSGVTVLEEHMEQILDLHDIIEEGAHFDTISQIVIKMVPIRGLEKLTIEEALKL